MRNRIAIDPQSRMNRAAKIALATSQHHIRRGCWEGEQSSPPADRPLYSKPIPTSPATGGVC
jgi:hypothetical protein